MKKVTLSFLIIFVFLSNSFAKNDKPISHLSKSATLEYKLFDANQITTWFGNNGEITSSYPTSESGLEYPSGSGLTAVFQSGLWLAGKVNGDIHTACAEYTTEFRPGAVQYDPSNSTTPGTAEDYGELVHQIYSINKGNCADPDSVNYNAEYVSWPVEYGAPAHNGEYFTDANNNGTYDSGENFEDYNLNGAYDSPDGIITKGEDPPLWLGDQVHWCVYNDFDQNKHTQLFNTSPLGVEVQQTTFGFNENSPLNHIMFIKFLIINKSGNTIDSLYISNWCDDDVGDANNDLVACDTSLNLIYTYNGTSYDNDYGSEVPAKASCLIQGPIVAVSGNKAFISNNIIENYKNLLMTSSPPIWKSSSMFPDPETAREAFNLMKGLETYSGTPFVNLITGDTTKYAYTGDPVTQTGWLDINPADRRSIMNTGPLTFPSWQDSNDDGVPQPGEPGVQEIVLATIIGQGNTNLKSITIMRHFAQYAHTFWRNGIEPVTIQSPTLTSSDLDKEIMLYWDNTAEQIPENEFIDYRFGGYFIYQGASANGPWTRIASMKSSDLGSNIIYHTYNPESLVLEEHAVRFLNAKPIANQLSVSCDSLQHQELVNNKLYHFAVSAFAWSPENVPAYVESEKSVLSVRPQKPAMGQSYDYRNNERLPVTFLPGYIDMYPEVIVTDPTLFNNETYAIRFNENQTSQAYWYLGTIDTTQTGTPMIDTVANYQYYDWRDTVLQTEHGYCVKMPEYVLNDPPEVYNTYIQTENPIETLTLDIPALHPEYGGVDTLGILNGDTIRVDTLCGPYKNWGFWTLVNDGSTVYFQMSKMHLISIQSNAKTMGKETALAKEFFGGGDSLTTEMLQSDIEFRFTETGQNATRWSLATFSKPDSLYASAVPFEVWDIEHDVQLCCAYWDNEETTITQGSLYNSETNRLDNDWFVIYFKDYAEYGDTLMQMKNDPYNGWLILFHSASVFSDGDVLQLYFINPINPETDEYRFTTPAVQTIADKDSLKKLMDKINVFPNPYFGKNAEESGDGSHFVTFSNLPGKDATIRIFSLGGQLVTTVEHINETPFEQWDLKNNQGKNVASGMYIAHIEVKDVGNKILKFAVLTQ